MAFLYKGGQILAIIDVSADTFSHFSCHIIRHIELIPMKYISEGCIYADYMQPIYWYLVESVTLPWINESPCLLLDQIHGSTDDFESDESDYMEAEETAEMGNARVYRNVFDTFNIPSPFIMDE